MSFAHEKAQAVIDALTADASDAVIAQTIANYFTTGLRLPCRFDINHNAKVAPCPVFIDKPGMKKSSAGFGSATDAHTWIVEALLRAYEVTGTTFRGLETKSIAGERRNIKHRADMEAYRASGAATRWQRGEVDDDIPF